MSSLTNINIHRLKGVTEWKGLLNISESLGPESRRAALPPSPSRQQRRRTCETQLNLPWIMKKNPSFDSSSFRSGRWLHTPFQLALFWLWRQNSGDWSSFSVVFSLRAPLPKESLLKYSGRLWMVALLSIYIPFIDSITFRWSQGEGFHLKFLQNIWEEWLGSVMINTLQEEAVAPAAVGLFALPDSEWI